VAKLCDFGWSAVVETSRKTYCGTFDYAPPEILERKNYDTSVDIWCIGVLTYELLTGRVPFEGDKRNVIRDKILNVRMLQFRSTRIESTTQWTCLPKPRSSSSVWCRRILRFGRSVTTYSSSSYSRCTSPRA
jgi:serine/threonine protein kinase